MMTKCKLMRLSCGNEAFQSLEESPNKYKVEASRWLENSAHFLPLIMSKMNKRDITSHFNEQKLTSAMLNATISGIGCVVSPIPSLKISEFGYFNLCSSSRAEICNTKEINL